MRPNLQLRYPSDLVREAAKRCTAGQEQHLQGWLVHDQPSVKPAEARREGLTHLLSELALASQIELFDDRVVCGTQHLHLRTRHVVTGRDMGSCSTSKAD